MPLFFSLVFMWSVEKFGIFGSTLFYKSVCNVELFPNNFQEVS